MAAGIFVLGALSFGLEAYSIVEGAKQAEEMAKAKKEDIGLQRESMKLGEEARKIKEVMAEAKVKKDLRDAQAKMVVRQAVSGVGGSSIFEAMETGIEAGVMGGLAKQRELAGITSQQSALAEARLDVAESIITAPTDLDTMLNIAGAGLSAGMLMYSGYKNLPEKKAAAGVLDTTDSTIGVPMDFDRFGRYA